MALGFKIADGYVEVHADYDKNELRRAAAAAANDFGDGFAKESRSNRKTRISSQLDDQVDRDRNRFRRIGAKIGTHIKNGLMSGPAFARNFIEAITFGQADFGKLKTAGIARVFGALGTAAGALFAAALIAEIGAAITAALPVVLGGLIAALPIIGLIKSGMVKDGGKWKTRSNEMGRALHKLVVEFKSFMKIIEAPMKAPLLDVLKAAGGTLQYLAKPLAAMVKAISPGVAKLFYGFFGFIRSFVTALGPAMPGINAGLQEWGRLLPGLGKALGDMFAKILADPDKVVQAVRNLFETLRLITQILGVLVPALTSLSARFHSAGAGISAINPAFAIFLSFIKQIPAVLAGLGPVFSRVWNTIKTSFMSGWNSIKAAFLVGWNAIKAAATAGINAVKSVIMSGVNAVARVWKALWNNQFSATVRNALGIVKDIWALALASIKLVLSKAAANIKAAWKALWSAVKSAASTAWSAIKTVINAAIAGIAASIKTRTAGIRSTVSSAWNAIKSATSSAWNAVKALTTAAWNLFVNTIKAKVAAAVAVVRTIRSAVTGALSGAGSWLVSAGKAIIQGLLNGINSMIGAVRSKLQSLTALIKASKGPPEKDKVLLYEAGQLLMHGLMGGIASKTGALQSQLGGLTNGIPAMAGGGGGAKSYSSTFSPNVVVHISEGLNPMNAAARRALIKDIFLELEQYKKDYVNR